MLRWLLIYAPLIQLAVLTATAIFIMVQMYQQGHRNRLDQLIAWKTSLHSLNQLVMKDPATFYRVLYPGARDEEHVKQLTAAYASLHALEAIYYMRKDEEFPPDRLEEFLRQYVAGDQMRNAWKVEAAHAAFTKEFQDKLNEIIGMEKVPPVQERITTLEKKVESLEGDDAPAGEGEPSAELPPTNQER